MCGFRIFRDPNGVQAELLWLWTRLIWFIQDIILSHHCEATAIGQLQIYVWIHSFSPEIAFIFRDNWIGFRCNFVLLFRRWIEAICFFKNMDNVRWISSATQESCKRTTSRSLSWQWIETWGKLVDNLSTQQIKTRFLSITRVGYLEMMR